MCMHVQLVLNGSLFSYGSEIAIVDNSTCVVQGIEDTFNSLVCSRSSKSCGVRQVLAFITDLVF